MSRPILILSRLALCAALACAAPSAHAQQGYGPQGYPQGYGPQYGQPQGYGPQYGQPQGYGPQYGQPGTSRNSRNRARNGNNSGENEGLIPLPEGVSRVVGIDAQNLLLVEMEPTVEGGPSEYRAIPVKHVYVGGIAKVFGGTTISTEEFVSPAFSKGRTLNVGNNPQGNFGGAQGFGSNGIGGYPGFNNGYPNNGYPNGGFLPGGVLPGGVLPGGAIPGYPNGVPNIGFGGGFVGSPQITYGIGGVTTTQIVPDQATTTTVQEGR